jgi:FKBP-type peptidyl-prolyl cis-trans isomerase
MTLCAFVALTAAACDKNPSSPSNAVNVAFSTADLRVGTGTEATNGRKMVVNYWGWLYSTTAAEHKGSLFDTSAGRGSFTFTLGAGQVITGWDRGVLGMKVGGLRRLTIPPDMAYGSSAVGSIPANSTLVFEVELVDVQ